MAGPLYTEDEEGPAPVFTDEDFLAIVGEERRQSIGFEHDSVLLSERERALNYYKGEMPDLPTMENRSQAVSTDIADAIDSLLPDLIEIFEGDDVVTFIPISEQDEQGADQETDYVRQVVFDENDGFKIFYSMFKDALQVKTGVAKAWWEKNPIAPEVFTGKSIMEMTLASQDGEIGDVQQAGTDDQQQPLFNFTLTKEDPGGRVKISPIPPEDFTVGRDTIELREATYCAFRSRPRAQQLIKDGYDPEVVRELPQYGTTTDQTLMLARDTAGEHYDMQWVVGQHDLRQVEIVEHYIRVDAREAGTPQIWRVVTGGTEQILLDKEEVDAIPFFGLTPIIVAHRFYGESIADRLIELQRIKTALTRMALDSGYFALNQRMEVAMDRSNAFTISDLLRNEPNMPVRSKSGDALRPLSAGALNFNPYEALEYFSVQVEQRTGIFRAAQGMDPDTLHDTASGAMGMLAAAQKRVRLIARIFAETGIKDMMLGVHALLRKHASGEAVKRIRGQWIPVDPSAWAERNQMAIQIGLGSAGRREELANMGQILGLQEKIVTMQGGAQGPIVTLTDVYNAVQRFTTKMGEKAPERFFSDPAQTPPPPPKPSPEMAKIQAQQQMEGQKLQLQGQVEAANHDREQAKIAADIAADQSKARTDALRVQMEGEERAAKLKMEQQRFEADERFRYAELAQKRELELTKLQAQFGQAVTIQQMKDDTAHDQMAADVHVQESEAQDAKEMSGASGE